MKRAPPKSQKVHLLKVAWFVSALGHPLVSGSAVGVLVFFQLFEFRKAVFLSGFILCLISIPVAAWIYYKTKSKEYTNFDVSVRTQRTSMYLFLLGILALAILLALFSQQTQSLFIGLSLCFAMVAISFKFNYFLKSSLHVAMSFFLAFSLWQVQPFWGVAMFFMALLVSASRLILKRHTLSEIISGSFIGSGTGALLFYILPV